MPLNITNLRIPYKISDSLVLSDKFLMDSPYGIFSIYSVNILINSLIIPIFMKNRKAFDFMKIIYFTDVLIIIRSIYFMSLMIYVFFWQLKSFNLWCIEINLRDPFEAEISWQFLMSMIIFLLQNFACSLGKKEGSIAIYLIVHHTSYPIVAWLLLTYYPSGHVRP